MMACGRSFVPPGVLSARRSRKLSGAGAGPPEGTPPGSAADSQLAPDGVWNDPPDSHDVNTGNGDCTVTAPAFSRFAALLSATVHVSSSAGRSGGPPSSTHSTVLDVRSAGGGWTTSTGASGTGKSGALVACRVAVMAMTSPGVSAPSSRSLSQKFTCLGKPGLNSPSWSVP